MCKSIVAALGILASGLPSMVALAVLTSALQAQLTFPSPEQAAADADKRADPLSQSRAVPNGVGRR